MPGTQRHNNHQVRQQRQSKHQPRPEPMLHLRSLVQVNSHGLVELNLSSHNLSQLPEQVFTCVRLEILRLDHNQLREISEAISTLHQLKQLYLSHNQLASLPDTLVNCTHLLVLHADHNLLATLPPQLGKMVRLRDLTLANNSFVNISHGIGELYSLKELSVASNSLWQVPFSLGSLHRLTSLNLSDNKLESFPTSLCHLHMLQQLDLHSNKLQNLPSDLSKLCTIRDLRLNKNQLDKIPSCVFHLRSLESINLSHNKLKKIPKRISKLPRLKSLFAHGNNIGDMPNDLLTLEYLNVSDNKMKFLSVARMKYLKFLNASNNFLETLPIGVCNLHHIEVLKLNSNKISFVTQDIGLITTLKVLDLGNNKLSSLPHCLSELDNLESLNTEGNKIEDSYQKDDDGTIHIKLKKSTEKPVRHPMIVNGKQKPAHSPKVVSVPWHMQKSKRKDAKYVRSRPALPDPGPTIWAQAVGNLQAKRHDLTKSRRKSKTLPARIRPAPKRVASRRSEGHSTSYVEDWVAERLQYPEVSIRSDAATAEGSWEADAGRGSATSLPQTDADFHLLGLCSDVETLLRRQVIKPSQSRRSARTSWHDSGAFVSSADSVSISSELDGSGSDSLFSPGAGTCSSHPARDPLFVALAEGIQCSKAEHFRVGPKGGLFRISANAHTSLYFPENAVPVPIVVSMYLQHINQELLTKARKERPLLHNLLSIGDMVQIQANKDVELNHRVSLTLPLPPGPVSGRLHVLTFWEDNTCSPSPTVHTLHGEYITVQCSQLAGKGAVITKSKCRYKACKSVEALLQQIFL